MNASFHGPIACITEKLKTEIGRLASSKEPTSKWVIASEDFGSLAMQVCYSSSLKNSHYYFGEHQNLKTVFGFVGSITQLTDQIKEEMSESAPLTISDATLAHYSSLLSGLGPLKGERMYTAIASHLNDEDSSLPIALTKALGISKKQIQAHGRTDRQSRAIEAQELMTNDTGIRSAVTEHVSEICFLVGPRTTDSELRAMESLAKYVGSATWLSSLEQHSKKSEFTKLSTTQVEEIAGEGSHKSAVEFFNDYVAGNRGVYLHENSLSLYSKIFYRLACLAALSVSLGNSIEAYCIMREMVDLPHDQAVIAVKRLREIEAKEGYAQAIDQVLGTSHLAKLLIACHLSPEDPELLLMNGYPLVSGTPRPKNDLKDANSFIIKDIFDYLRFIAKSSSSVRSFHSLVSLYPYSGRYPITKILIK